MTYFAFRGFLIEKISHIESPEIVFGTSDSAVSQAIRRAVKANKLRKLATTELVNARQCRIIVPTVYREDY